jgi:Cdc6-like AAA superfamily ATPase
METIEVNRSAAPEMYDALQMALIALLRLNSDGSATQAIDEIRTALEKAES